MSLNWISLAFNVLSLAAQIHSHPHSSIPSIESGMGTLLIAACEPGETVVIEPGDIRVVADPEGVATVQVPAQTDGSDSYIVLASRGSAPMNGTLSKNESLSGICP
jgi:hypothetical protein